MKRNHVFAPYVFDSGVDALRVRDIERITHLNFAFMLIKDGKGDLSHIKPGVLDSIRACKKVNPDLKLVVSLGGWGAGGFSNACQTEEGIEKLASSTVKLALKEGFDGIDVDWEYPCSGVAGIDYSSNDRENFTKLLKALRKHLDTAGEGRPLTIAVGAAQSCVDSMEVEEVAATVDYVNLMTYDLRSHYTDECTGHHTNLYPQSGDPNGPCGVGTVEMFHKAGVPYEKLVLGSAFYGKGWTGCNSWLNNGLGVKAGPIGRMMLGGSYEKIKSEYIGKDGYVRFWDDNAKAPYVYNGENFISYEDPDSIREKCKYVKETGLAGMMYWAYGSHELFEAIAENLD